MNSRSVLSRGALAVSTVLLPAAGSVQARYPEKPLRLLVGNAPGGGSDITARNVADRLSESLGRPFVVDNRSGAGGAIAMSLPGFADSLRQARLWCGFRSRCR